MYFYIVYTILLAFCLWNLIKCVKYYMDIFRWSSKLPAMTPSHWFWGFLSTAKDFNGLLAVGQKYVDKSRVKWFHSWTAILYANVVPVHPDYMKVFLSKHNVPKNHGIAGPYRMLKPWIGDGLLTSNHKKWERNRRLLTPALHFNILKPYVAIYHDVSDILLKKLEALGTGEKSLDICPLISRATLDTMLRCTLSYQSEAVQSTGSKMELNLMEMPMIQTEGTNELSTLSDQHSYVQAVNQLKHLLLKRCINPLVYMDFVYRWTADCKEFKKCCDLVHEFSNNIIQSRKKSLEDDPSQLEKRYLDFLDILITARDEKGAGLTEQEIRDEVDTFMFAGHDTTASAIMWILYALATYPVMQQRVREDIEEVLQGRKYLEADDLPKLNYTTCFIKESLRMYTPVPAVTRKLDEPVTVDGINFPSGTVVDINPYLLHHNPAVWENDMKFDPERFTQENITKKDAFAFLPFSAGQRNCIGQNFAMNEIKTIVSRIVTRFQIHPDASREATPYAEVIMSAKDGIFLHFRDI